LDAGLETGLDATTSSSSFGTASSSSSSSSGGRIGADGGLADRVAEGALTDRVAVDGSNDFGGGGGRLREGLTDCFTFDSLDGVGSTVTTVLCGLRDWAKADSMVGADVGAEALIDTSGGGGKLSNALMDGSGIGGKLNDAAFTDLLGAAEDNGVTEGATDCFKLGISDPIGL